MSGPRGSPWTRSSNSVPSPTRPTRASAADRGVRPTKTKVLIEENLPRKLAGYLQPHESRTVRLEPCGDETRAPIQRRTVELAENPGGLEAKPFAI
jgi:hypothetical protein